MKIISFLLTAGLTPVVLAVLVLTAARCLGAERLGRGRRALPLSLPTGPAGEGPRRWDTLRAAGWAVGALALAWLASVLYVGIFAGPEVSAETVGRAWQRYDAVHYLRLASVGYQNNIEDGQHLTLVFFPLYPWLMRLLHLVIPSWAVCGHLLSGGCYVGACCLFFRLTAGEFGRRAGFAALAFLSAYPFAFFFASLHTESLFLLTSLACFTCIRKHRYPLAGLFGVLACLTRMQGAFLAFVALAEYCASQRPFRKLRARDWRGLWRDLWGKLIWMPFMWLGTGCYLLLNYWVEGDPFRFLVYQREHWYQGLQWFTASLSGLLRAAISPSQGYEFCTWTTWLPQFVLFVLCLALLIYSVRRLPPAWTVWCVVCIFLNYSLTNPLSCCRYIACAFPLPVALALLTRGRPGLERGLLAASGVLQGVFLMAYLAGRHVC